MAITLNVAFILSPSNLSADLNWGVFKAFEVLLCNSSSHMPHGPEDQFGNLVVAFTATNARGIKVHPAV